MFEDKEFFEVCTFQIIERLMSEIKTARVIKNIITQPTYQCLLDTKKIAHSIELELSLLSRKLSRRVGKKLQLHH